MSDFTYSVDSVIEEDIGYATRVSSFENGVEQRRSVRSSSIRKFSLNFQNRTQAEMEQIRDFFIAKLGQLTSFTWTNPNDSVEYTVRFSEDSFKHTRDAYDIYNFQCQFVQVL